MHVCRIPSVLLSLCTLLVYLHIYLHLGMKLAHLCMQMCFVFSLGYVNLKAFILRNCIFCLSLAYRASSSFIRSQWGAGRPGTSVPNLRPKLHSPQKGQDVPGTCVGGLTGCHTYHFGGRCHHLPWPLLLPASWKRNWMWGCGQRVWLLVWEGVTKGLSARVKKVYVKNENEIERSKSKTLSVYIQ